MSNVFNDKYLSRFIKVDCLPLCPLERNSTEYHTQYSYMQLIGDLYADYLRENPNLLVDFVTKPINSQTAQQSFVNVYIHYETLSYTL